MSKIVKARFAPSPTGLIHLGNMRTALFNYLYAKSSNGKFYIRIEDTDKERSTAEHRNKLLNDVYSLGLRWEGGEDNSLEGIICQSEREDIYNEYFDKLIDGGYAYPCYCSPEELQKSRDSQRRRGHAPKYAGTCRNLTIEERKEKETKGLKASLRFNVSKGQDITYVDLVQGKKVFKSEDIGDFIIRKSDGGAAFFFSNVLDDALTGMNCVLRGEDHLTNTPRQLMIVKALGLPEAEYGHLPLIVGDDSKPLSKRNGSVSIDSCTEEGILPIALLNYLARLGHKYTSDDLLSLAELCDNFSLERVGRSPSRFDKVQLKHWQKEAVARLSQDEFYSWNNALVSDEIKEQFYITVKSNVVNLEEVGFWKEQLLGNMTLSDDAVEFIKSAGDEYYDAALSAVKSHSTDYKAIMSELKTNLGIAGKKLFMPMRAAVTGQTSGPELINVFTLLGKDKIIKRLENAKQA